MIHTKRLVLRRARPEDTNALHPIFSDPRAMRYWSTLPHTEIAQTENFVAGMIHGKDADEFVIEFEGKVIGKAGIWRKGEIGFILAPDVWGRGLGFEACKVLLEHYFDTHPNGVLIADVDPRNEASLKLLDNLGFRRTGYEERTFQLGDEWCDSVYLELRGS